MEVQGYPQFAILAVLGIGILLAILKPYKAFLLALVLLTAGNATIFNQTRTSLLGPYLNLGDACLLVVIMALFFDRYRSKKPLRVPQVVPLILFALTISALQSFWKLGWTYETARAYRWGLQLPIAYFLGANLVTSSNRAKGLLAALLCGAVLSALQHLFFILTVWSLKSLNMQSYHLMRTIDYLGGCLSPAFLVTAVIWKLPGNIRNKIFSLTTGLLFLASLFLNQTRSVWLATVGAIGCLLVLFKRRRRVTNVMKFGVIIVLMVFAMAWVCQQVMPGLDVSELAVDRIRLLLADDTRNMHMGTRERAFKTEMSSWLDGTLIFGQGLQFMQTIRNPESGPNRIAFGHLGYVTYLSQMGLIGLLAYGLYFPLRVLHDAQRLWRNGGQPVLRYMGLLGAASIILLSIMFLMSSNFLGLGYFAPSVLYGSLWSLAKPKRNELDNNKYILTTPHTKI
jgi:hypothetical protein